MVLILFGRDQSLFGLDRSALVYRASLDFDWFPKLKPDVGEVLVPLIVMQKPDDEIEFKQGGVIPEQSTNNKGNGKLNEDYNLHFEFRGVVR